MKSSIKIKLSFLLFFSLIATGIFSQSIIYVKADATGANNGTSWTDAYPDLQDALSSTTAGDTIWVAKGTYKPTADKTGNVTPSDDRTKTFALIDSISLYGGFAGTETALSQRDIEHNETILSGDIGTVGDSTDNCYNVIQTSSYDVISGFTIASGNANGSVSNETDMGGAVLSNSVEHVKVDSCKVINCFGMQGGSIANYFCGDSIIITHCRFLNNIAGNGGAIGNWDTDPIISFCVFENNIADESIHTDWGMGGAIFNWGSGSTTKTINCTFVNNNARTAVVHDRGVYSSVKNSIFLNNKVNDFYYVGSVTYCLTQQSGYVGLNGNIDANPLLYNRGNGIYEMSWVSPCIDAGDPASEYNDTDGSRNNMGAAHPIFLPAKDAFIFSIDTPENESFLYGEHSVSVKISNIGTSTLNDVPVNWSVDGVNQSTYDWSGSLSSPDTSETITIGTYNFTGGYHTLKVWTSVTGDEYAKNDTLTKEFKVLTHLDAGITSLNKPATHFNNETSTDVFVSIKNFRSDSSIYHLKIGWSVDGSNQTAYTYNDTILPNTTVDSINIGSYSFSRGKHTIKIWTFDPNGLADDDNSNDTLIETIYSIVYDIGIANVFKPNNPDTVGTIPIIVSYKNFGFRDVTSARIYWQINSETPQSYDKSGTLTSGETSEYFEIGTYNFASQGTYLLKVWTSKPSGDDDDFHANDTLTKTITIGEPMCGIYTIGSSGDIANFSDAVDSLITKGINGDVIFKVQSGTYNEQVTLPYILGVSDSNTIVFESASGDSTDVIISNSSGSALLLKGAKYVTFRGLTITADSNNIISTSDSVVNVTFENNVIKGITSNYQLFYISNYGLVFRNLSFLNNRFENGTQGIVLEHYGNTTISNFIIKDNIFKNINGNNISLYRVNNILISGNVFRASTNVTAIYINERKGINKIEANKIILPQGGTGIRYNSYSTSDYTDTIINNSIYVNNGDGIYISYPKNKDSLFIAYNSINITGNSGININNSYNAEYLKILLYNNILANTTGNYLIYQYYGGYYGLLVIGDYNCFYHPSGKISYYRQNLKDIQSEDQVELHSFELNPHFESDSNLMIHNPLFDGVAIPISGITTDVDGNIRNTTTPDMGAYEFTRLSGLKGTYEIGPSAPLFKTFNDAVDSLILVGADSTVIFNVESGTYNEQVILPKIFEADSSTITFQSATGDSTDVVLTYSATESDKNFTLQFAGVDNIIFKNITIKSENTSYSNVIKFIDNNFNNIFTGNIIEGQPNTGQLIHFKYKGTEYGNTFENNRLLYGKTGIFWNLDDDYYYNDSANIVVRNNYFENQSDTGIYLNNCKNSEISGNTIHSSVEINAIYLNKTYFSTISRNKIHINSGEGIYLYYSSYSSDSSLIMANNIRIDNGGLGIAFNYSKNNSSQITNNNILLNTNTTNSDYGIYLDAETSTITPRIYHNTIRITGNNDNSYCIYRKYSCGIIMNNILSNTAGSHLISSYVNSDYNAYFTTKDKNKIIGNSSLEYVQAIDGSNLHSFFGNPYFMNDTSCIPQNRLLNNSGDSLAIATDIDGNARDMLHPDMGAYEFTPNLTPMHGTYTIGASGNFTSFTQAVDTATLRGVDGAVIFNVEPGTYDEQVFISKIYGVSDTNTITFQSATGDSTDVVLTYSGDITYDKYILTLYKTHHFVIKNITIKSTKDGSIPVLIKRDISDNTFMGNVFVANSTNDNIINVESVIDRDSSVIFTGNYFKNGATALQFNAYYGGELIKSAVVGNIFSNIKKAISSGGGLKIYNNTINSSIPCVAISGSNTQIYNNTISLTNGGTGIEANKASLIAFNTIKVLGSGYALTAQKHCMVYNNILIADEYGLKVYDTTECQIDNNAYYSYTKDKTVVQNAYILEYWQSHFGFDRHSFILNIEFDDDSTLYSDNAWLNNAGVNVPEVTTDKYGNVRNTTTPDIGAYEFDGLMPLSGVYTVGATGHFSDLSQVVDSLSICGVRNSVAFQIQQGVYTEQITLTDSNIVRMPDTAAIVFQSLSGDSTDVILQYQASATNNYIINLDSISYVTIKNITLQALDSTYSVVLKSRSSSHNVIANNVLKGAGNTSPVIYSANGVDEYNHFENNKIIGGRQGIVWIGEENSNERNNIFANNILSNQYAGGIFVKYQTINKILRNQVYHLSPVQDTTWIGIGVYNMAGASWNNTINYVANNMISCNATNKTAGIHNYNSQANIIYNSVNIFGDNAPESRAFNYEGGNVDVKNNIFINKAHGLVYYGSPSESHCDYNNVFTNGDNFAYRSQFFATFNDWIKDKRDVNSWTSDSVFVSDTNLHLNSGVLMGKGTTIFSQIATDIDGNKRFANFATIGADEIPIDTTIVLNGYYTIGESGDFNSFGKASKALAVCGVSGSVTFNILSGTYNEPIFINNVKGISTNDTITFHSQTGSSDDVKIKFKSTGVDAKDNTYPYNMIIAANDYIIKIANVPNLKIENLTLQALDSLSNRIIVIGDSVKDVTISRNKLIGIKNKFTNNQNDKSVCIRIYGKYDNPNFEISNNEIYYNSLAIKDNLYREDHSDSINYIHISKNTFFDNIIYLWKPKNTIIEHNHFTNQQAKEGNDEYIFLWGDSSTFAYNHINYSLKDIHMLFARNIYIYNNFISAKIENVNASNNLINLSNYQTSNNSLIYNNSIYMYGYKNTNASAISLTSVDTAYNNIIVNISGNRSITGNGISDYNNIYPNLSDLQATGNDSHSMSFISRFASDTDLHTTDARLYQRGMVVPEITTDIDSEARNNPPCIGADEFDSPTFKAGKDTAFCFYDTVYFQAQNPFVYDIGQGYDSYQWSNGSDSSSIIIDTGYANIGNNVYTVTVTVGANTYSDTVNIHFGKPTVFNYQEYCLLPDDELTLVAAQNNRYLWSTGDTTQSITIENNSSVYLTVSDEYGCEAKESSYNNDSIVVHIVNSPANIFILTDDGTNHYEAPDDTMICSRAEIVLAGNSDEDTQEFSYLWSTGDTTSHIIVDTSHFGVGTHIISVMVSTTSGCMTYDTINVKIKDCTGIDAVDYAHNSISIYPNPANDKLILDGEVSKIKNIDILDVSGKYINRLSSYSQAFIDTRNLDNGVYFIKITFKDFSSVVKKFVVSH